MARLLPYSAALLLLPFTARASCSGLSNSCEEKTSQKACEDWATCKWSSENSGAAEASAVSVCSCGGGLVCNDKKERDCEFFSTCTWCADNSPRRRRSVRYFCAGKSSGSYCSEGNRVTCTTGQMRPSASEYCSDGRCSEKALEAACGTVQFCAGKESGYHCDGRYLKECGSSGFSEVSRFDCREAGCSEGPGMGKAACGDATFCAGKTSGLHCDGNAVKSCPSNQMLEICRGGVTCQEGPGLGVATCGSSTFCVGKMSGSHCDGTYLKVCSEGKTTSSMYCGSSCSDFAAGQAECGTAQFCAGRVSGDYCDGHVLKSCSGGSLSPALQVLCEGGCVQAHGVGEAGCRAALSLLGFSNGAATVMRFLGGFGVAAVLQSCALGFP